MIDVTRKSVEERQLQLLKFLKLKNKTLMINKLILASIVELDLQFFKNNNYDVKQYSSGVDEDEVKLSLIYNGATPLQIAKNLAELKANQSKL